MHVGLERRPRAPRRAAAGGRRTARRRPRRRRAARARARSAWPRARRYAAPGVRLRHRPTGSTASRAACTAACAPARATRRSRAPVVLNTWEAVYFDHDLDRLKALADAAARRRRRALRARRRLVPASRATTRAGLGRLVRRRRTSGRDGLQPARRPRPGLGMEFGLWFEPEMVNPDSDLVRAHPDWVLRRPGRPGSPRAWRHQQVLDLANPDACGLPAGAARRARRRVRHRLPQVGPQPRPARGRSTGTRHASGPACTRRPWRSTRLLDELRARHPGLEIESCCQRRRPGRPRHPGPHRPGLGVGLQRRRRAPAIQRWTASLLPPELVGAHVGPPRSPTRPTAHRSDLPFRLATALFGHAGLEWDLTQLHDDELGRLRGLVRALPRAPRPLLHTGDVVRADAHRRRHRAARGRGSPTGREAVYCFVRLATSPGRAARPAAPARARPGPARTTSSTAPRRRRPPASGTTRPGLVAGGRRRAPARCWHGRPGRSACSTRPRPWCCTCTSRAARLSSCLAASEPGLSRRSQLPQWPLMSDVQVAAAPALRDAADSRLPAPRQLPRRPGAVGGAAGRPRGVLLRRRPARDHRRARPRGRCAERTRRTAAQFLAGGHRPAALDAVRAEPRRRARPAGVGPAAASPASARPAG